MLNIHPSLSPDASIAIAEAMHPHWLKLPEDVVENMEKKAKAILKEFGEFNPTLSLFAAGEATRSAWTVAMGGEVRECWIRESSIPYYFHTSIPGVTDHDKDLLPDGEGFLLLLLHHAAIFYGGYVGAEAILGNPNVHPLHHWEERFKARYICYVAGEGKGGIGIDGPNLQLIVQLLLYLMVGRNKKTIKGFSDALLAKGHLHKDEAMALLEPVQSMREEVEGYFKRVIAGEQIKDELTDKVSAANGVQGKGAFVPMKVGGSRGAVMLTTPVPEGWTVEPGGWAASPKGWMPASEGRGRNTGSGGEKPTMNKTAKKAARKRKKAAQRRNKG